MTFIVSSHFITVLGGNDVDLEMPNFLGKVWKKIGKTIFESRGWDKKDSRKDK
jgi:hypothetical protein